MSNILPDPSKVPLGIGFINKEDLMVFEGEDLEKFKNCRWMVDSEYKKYDNIAQRRIEALRWYHVLVKSLPHVLLIDLKKDMDKVSFVFNFERFEKCIKYARNNIIRRILADDRQKIEHEREKTKKYFEETKKREEQQILNNLRKNVVESTTLEEYKQKSENQLYEYGTPQWKKQREQKIIGYIPTLENMLDHPPIEIIEYAGCKLIKYDMLHGIYVNIVTSGNYINYENSKILYQENPIELEERSKINFDEMVKNKLKDTKNPYGKIEDSEDVDISHIKEVMGYDKNNPLNKKNIF